MTRTTSLEPIHAAHRQMRDVADAPDPVLGFERLHALVRGGYVPQIGAENVDSSIVLDHAGKGPRLRLFPDGSIQVLDKSYPIHPGRSADRFRIAADDDVNYRKFARLIEGMPSKRRGKWRRRILVPLLLIAAWFVSISLTIMIAEGL